MLNQTEDNCQLFSSGEVYNTSIRQAAPGAVEFLTSLFSNCQNGYINIRCFPSKNNLFLSQTDLQDLLPYFLETNQDESIFIGVALREWNNGTKDGITEIPALFIDQDIYKLSNEEREECCQRYENFPLKASFEINSGRGRYKLWMLKEPATKEDISIVWGVGPVISIYLS